MWVAQVTVRCLHRLLEKEDRMYLSHLLEVAMHVWKSAFRSPIFMQKKSTFPPFNNK